VQSQVHRSPSRAGQRDGISRDPRLRTRHICADSTQYNV